MGAGHVSAEWNLEEEHLELLVECNGLTAEYKE